jgi:alpha-tubulin suppressor-like RCC1 family protein
VRSRRSALFPVRKSPPAAAADGKVLTWGNNGSGQLGRTIAGPFTEKPGAVVFPGPHTRIISVAAGCFFTLALTSSGQVLSWGANEAGELGIGATPRDDPHPVPAQVHLPAGVQITAITAGIDFAAALTSTGQVYAWGTTRMGSWVTAVLSR